MNIIILGSTEYHIERLTKWQARRRNIIAALTNLYFRFILRRRIRLAYWKGIPIKAERK